MLKVSLHLRTPLFRRRAPGIFHFSYQQKKTVIVPTIGILAYYENYVDWTEIKKMKDVSRDKTFVFLTFME